MNNTFMANPDKVERKWYVVDATGYTLGRSVFRDSKGFKEERTSRFSHLIWIAAIM